MRFPLIDYEAHPAYAPYAAEARFDVEFLATQLREADSAYIRYCSAAAPSEEDAQDVMAQIRNAGERIMQHVRSESDSVIAQEWVHNCLRWTLVDISYELMRRVFSACEYRSTRLAPQQSRQLAAMRDSGMYITELSPGLYAEIRRLALQSLDELKARALRDPYNRSVINMAFGSPLWRIVKKGMQDAGVIDVLSELKGNRMTLLGGGLEYSSPEQRWYQSLYADVGLPDGPFQYLHIDEGYCLPKAMIYMTPVNEDNGPTRAIPGSNCWQHSEFQLRMYRALDRTVGDRYDRFADSGNYRVMARHRDLRRTFMEMPSIFRGSSHFGDDVLPGSSVAEMLSGLETPYVSEGGQTLVFDGPQLLHRGSLVRTGERLALQVIFRNRNEARIKSHLARETFLTEQLALGRKYARRFVMGYL